MVNYLASLSSLVAALYLAGGHDLGLLIVLYDVRYMILHLSFKTVTLSSCYLAGGLLYKNSAHVILSFTKLQVAALCPAGGQLVSNN